MERPFSQRHLHAVVVGFVLVRKAVDLTYIWELTKGRSGSLIHGCVAGIAREAARIERRIARQNLVHHWIGRTEAGIRRTQGRLVDVGEA